MMEAGQVKKRGRPPLVTRKVKVTMLMHPGLKVGLEEMADERGVGYQTLAQEILGDAVADWHNWKQAEPRHRFAFLGYDLKQAIARADEVGELPPEMAEGAERVKKLIRRARRELVRLLKATATPGLHYVSAAEVRERMRERERVVMERIARDPDAPLVDVDEDL